MNKNEFRINRDFALFSLHLRQWRILDWLLWCDEMSIWLKNCNYKQSSIFPVECNQVPQHRKWDVMLWKCVSQAGKSTVWSEQHDDRLLSARKVIIADHDLFSNKTKCVLDCAPLNNQETPLSRNNPAADIPVYFSFITNERNNIKELVRVNMTFTR